LLHDDPNLPYLRTIAEALGDLRDRLVFVGGATAGLLVTDPLADSVRATKDVDAIVEARLAQFHRIEEQIANSGFVRDRESGVVCRWIHRDSGVLFDLMPVDASILGFSNRWYAYAVETAQTLTLAEGLNIRVVTAAAFVATKLEAFADRGRGDILLSHDLEDILNVIDGREELAQELAVASAALREAIRTAFTALLAHPDFANALPGLIADANRADIVLQRLRSMAAQSVDSDHTQ
jgi:aspartate oxidase